MLREMRMRGREQAFLVPKLSSTFNSLGPFFVSSRISYSSKSTSKQPPSMTSKGPPSRWLSFPPAILQKKFFDCLFCLPGYRDTDPHPHTKKVSKVSLRMMDFKVGTNNSMQKGRSIKYKVNYYTRIQSLHPILFLYHSVKKRKHR